MKLLQAYTVHGVADRVGLALRGWKLAQATGRGFQYIWQPHPDLCNCAFERLFSTQCFPVLGKFAIRPVLGINHGTFSELARNIPWMSADPICLHDLFGHDYDDFAKVFAPAPEVEAAVRRFQKEVLEVESTPPTSASPSSGNPATPQVIGIHVRRTDKKKEHLPADADYFRALDPLLEQQPGSMLFLATDDLAVEAAFRARYGRRIKTYPVRTYARSSPEGIVDAVIVLYLLRAADRVVAGVYSGYSLLAAWNRPFVKVATATSPVVCDWEGQPIDYPCSRPLPTGQGVVSPAAPVTPAGP